MRKPGIGSHTKANRGATDDWITPKEIIDALGGYEHFDLDPCECDEQPWPCAKESFCFGINGLSMPWRGRVWLNPPYGQQTAQWLKKLADHGRGTALIFARTETEMFHRYAWERATAFLFLEGRIYFHLPTTGQRANGNAGGPSVLIAYGTDDADVLRRCSLKGAFVSVQTRNP